MPTVLVTGASGFVGGPVCAALGAAGWTVRRAAFTRAGPGDLSIALAPGSDWDAAVAGCDAVVHLAARTHILAETEADPLAAFRHANRDASLNLGRAAAAAGVGRMVFLSSVTVHGNVNPQHLTEASAVAPQTPYARSKLEAEEGLLALSRETGLPVTILRPPLVYGPGVKARFLTMLRWVARGVPLPLGAVRNRRSLIGVGNLADVIATAVSTDHARTATYLVSDDEDVSTPDLIRRLAAAFGRPPRLLPVPVAALEALGGLLGRRAEIGRLTGSLSLDPARVRAELGWSPPETLDAGLRRTASWYVQKRQ